MRRFPASIGLSLSAAQGSDWTGPLRAAVQQGFAVVELPLEALDTRDAQSVAREVAAFGLTLLASVGMVPPAAERLQVLYAALGRPALVCEHGESVAGWRSLLQVKGKVGRSVRPAGDILPDELRNGSFLAVRLQAGSRCAFMGSLARCLSGIGFDGCVLVPGDSQGRVRDVDLRSALGLTRLIDKADWVRFH